MYMPLFLFYFWSIYLKEKRENRTGWIFWSKFQWKDIIMTCFKGFTGFSLLFSLWSWKKPWYMIVFGINYINKINNYTPWPQNVLFFSIYLFAFFLLLVWFKIIVSYFPWSGRQKRFEAHQKKNGLRGKV